ncbi:MAG: Hsp20/alpha crystallin family protein [Victivallaceae bacterium]
MSEETKNTPQANNKLLTALVVILLIVAVVQSVFMFNMYCGQCPKQDMAADELNNPPPPIAPPTAVPLKPLPKLKSIIPGGSQPLPQTPAYQTIDPFQEIQKMQEEMDRAFDAALNRFRNSPGFKGGDQSIFFEPQMNIMDNGDKYVIKFDMPGLTKDDISVELENHVLTISGKSSQETKRQDDRMLLTERHSGQFSRSVMLPGDVDDSKLKADCKDGVLTVIVPKVTESPKTQKIQVQ